MQDLRSIYPAWLLISGLALAGCRQGLEAGNVAVAAPPGTAPTASAEAVEVVLAGPPVRKSLKLVSAQPARIEALEQAPIQSKLAAYVAEVAVDFGDKVKKDQPLVKLTAPEIDADVAQKQALSDQARAELAQAQAGVKAAEASVVTAKSQVTQTAAAIDRAAAEVNLRESEHQRIDKLVSGGSVNRQLGDEAEQKLQAAKASAAESQAGKASAQALVAEAEAKLAKAAADVDAAQARTRVAAANVASAEALRSYLTILAPFDGAITSRRVDPGHFVQPASASGGPLLIVSRIDKVRVFVAIPESEAALVDVGDEALVEVPSLAGAQVEGRVTRTSLALDEANRTLETIIDLDNADGRLRPGVYATVRLTLQEHKDVLTLPSAAVVRQGYDAFCYLIASGRAVKTPIKLGLRVGDDYEITSGITAESTVILNKAAALKDGQAVEASKPPT